MEKCLQASLCLSWMELRLLAALVSGDRLLTNVLIRPGWYAVAAWLDILTAASLIFSTIKI